MVPRVTCGITLVPIKRTTVHTSGGVPGAPTLEAMTASIFLLVPI